MKHVGIVEASTNLSTLVEEVEKGNAVVITRDGKPVARLVPEKAELTPDEVARRTEALLALRKFANEVKVNLTPEEIKETINEGRH